LRPSISSAATSRRSSGAAAEGVLGGAPPSALATAGGGGRKLGEMEGRGWKLLKTAAAVVFLWLLVDRAFPSIPLSFISHEGAPLPDPQAEPEQRSERERGPWTEKRRGDLFTITPRATYDVTALVANKERYWQGPTGALAPWDFVLTWGELTREPGESVLGSPYAITRGSLAANSNYTLGFTPNNLIIIGAAAEPIPGFNPAQFVYVGVSNSDYYYRPGNFWHISLNPDNADPGFDVMRGTSDLKSRLGDRLNSCDSVSGGGFCETWSFPEQREKVDNE